MGVGAGLYMYDVVVKSARWPSSSDDFLLSYCDLHIYTPVSYTHLTLPTNREV